MKNNSNMCLNYIFIYGNFGAPELGIVGAAIATLVSRIIELIIILRCSKCYIRSYKCHCNCC